MYCKTKQVLIVTIRSRHHRRTVRRLRAEHRSCANQLTEVLHLALQKKSSIIKFKRVVCFFLRRHRLLLIEEVVAPSTPASPVLHPENLDSWRFGAGSPSCCRLSWRDGTVSTLTLKKLLCRLREHDIVIDPRHPRERQSIKNQRIPHQRAIQPQN